MRHGSGIRTVHYHFNRHNRRYCLFSLEGDDKDFLFFSHTKKPLRSLVFGRNFQKKLPGLMEDKNLCIECGLGLSVAGGVALDSGECIAWNCTVEQANHVLTCLREHLGDEGPWIELFFNED
ncbi:MAG: hypothetical protein WC586_00345 [Methanoregula sp.]